MIWQEHHIYVDLIDSNIPTPEKKHDCIILFFLVKLIATKTRNKSVLHKWSVAIFLIVLGSITSKYFWTKKNLGYYGHVLAKIFKGLFQ